MIERVDVLGAKPLLGRTIAESEDVPNGANVAILGYPLYKLVTLAFQQYGLAELIQRQHDLYLTAVVA